MDPLARTSAFIDRLVRKAVIFCLVVAAVVGGGMYLARDPSGAELLQQANPGWTVVAKNGRPTRLDDGSGKGELMLGTDDVWSYRVTRVDCDEVKKAWPRWFALPDVMPGNCARLDGDDGARWVLNVTTPMRVTEIWDRHFGPLADRKKLGYAGGRSGRFPEGAATDLPAGQSPPEERGAGGYLLDPPIDSGERPVAISFYTYGGSTELIFTFRPPVLPSAPSPASPTSAP
jgi:hypothetical protein